MHAATQPHPSSTMMIIDETMIKFPIVQVECKIRVPDQLVGRLIGKAGICLKKIMDETQTHISISESRGQQEANSQYQVSDLYDRIITIRGQHFNSVLAAEKNVQLKLRQFYEQDLNMGNSGGQHHQYAIVNPVEGPYITQGVPPPILTNPATTYISPQPFYIQNPATTNFTTGQYVHNNFQMPNSVHIKSRVYVPNQIVGILIGTKGQTIKSVIAESGAIISIEGDREPKPRSKKEIVASTPSVGNHKEEDCNNLANKERETAADCLENTENLESLSIAEPPDANNGEPGKKPECFDGEDGTDLECEEPAKDGGRDSKQTNGSPPAAQQVPADRSQCSAAASNPQSIETNKNVAVCGDQQNSHNHGSEQNQLGRSVFIAGYDFQVYRAQSWVFQKVAENQNLRSDEIILTCEAIVPSKVVGRIIGKGGHNVKQLQQRSGAHIKVPDDINQNDKNFVEVAVRIIGNLCAVITVFQHFGMLITVPPLTLVFVHLTFQEAEWRESREYDERRSRYREGSR